MHAGRRLRIVMACLALATAGGCAKGPVAPAASTATPDLSGTWLPDPERADAWPADLPLTPTARTAKDNFDPSVSDPSYFCMPLGTPRNMLQTEYPLEIVQTPTFLLLVVQPNLSNSEVRRVPVDGSAMPESPYATWFGTSRGRWDGQALVVETVALRPDAPVSGEGITHSEDLRVVERLSLVSDAKHGESLLDEIELHDAKAYQQPLKTRRYFVRVPQARVPEGNCVELLWIDKLWRNRLAEHATAWRKAGKAP